MQNHVPLAFIDTIALKAFKYFFEICISPELYPEHLIIPGPAPGVGGCPIHGSLQGQVGWNFEQPGLAEGDQELDL